MNHPIVIVGAGPAGMTAAYELIERDLRPIVLEKAKVGGLARTETYKGFRFDIGDHRFFTKDRDVRRLWHEMMRDDFLCVSRLSRIYYRGRFDYPLNISNTLSNLGVVESLLIVLRFLKAQVWPYPEEETFEQ